MISTILRVGRTRKYLLQSNVMLFCNGFSKKCVGINSTSSWHEKYFAFHTRQIYCPIDFHISDGMSYGFFHFSLPFHAIKLPLTWCASQLVDTRTRTFNVHAAYRSMTTIFAFSILIETRCSSTRSFNWICNWIWLNFTVQDRNN